MNELANTEGREMARLEELAAEARMYSEGAAYNMLQLGRVFHEAKRMVAHGEWGDWVRGNAGVSERTAQQFMQAYRKFGDDARMLKLSPSKVMRLARLPEEGIDDFLRENDAERMSVRDIDEAIRERAEKIREEERARAEGLIRQAQTERDRAVEAAEAMARREPEIPQELLDELEEARREAQEARDGEHEMGLTAKKAADAKAAAEQEARRLAREMEEQEELLKEQQEEVNRVQAELLDLKSQMARGETARGAEDTLDARTLGMAVREFLGAAARVPYMASAFRVMNQADVNAFRECLAAVEGWAQGARRALDGYAEGGLVIE